MGLVLMHVVIAGLVVIGSHLADHAVFHVGTVALALLALIPYALAEGWRSTQERERYATYRAATQAILDRYSLPAATRESKSPCMTEFEEVSFRELESFSKLQRSARFFL